MNGIKTLEKTSLVLSQKKYESWSDTINYQWEPTPDCIYPCDLEYVDNLEDTDSGLYIKCLEFLNSEMHFKLITSLIAANNLVIDQYKFTANTESKFSTEYIKLRQQPFDLWWRLHIDPKDQGLGSGAYSVGSPVSETTKTQKPEYLFLLYQADKFLEKKYLSANNSLNFELYRSLHSIAVTGEDYVSAPFNPLLELRRGLVRTIQGGYGFVDAVALAEVLKRKPNNGLEYIDKDDLDLFTEDLEHMVANGEYFAGVRGFYLDKDPDKLQATLDSWFDQFNINIALGYGDESKIIKEIANIYYKLEVSHPFPDGNGRTNRALLNALLTEHGLSKTIFTEPGCAHYLTIDRIIEEIKLGQERYQFFKSKQPDLTQADIESWEQEHGITREFTIYNGRKLHTFWRACERYQDTLKVLIARYRKVDNTKNIPAEFKSRFKIRLLDAINNVTINLDDSYKQLTEELVKINTNFPKESEYIKQQRQGALKSIMLLILEAKKLDPAIELSIDSVTGKKSSISHRHMK